jgi:protein SCO1/2
MKRRRLNSEVTERFRAMMLLCVTLIFPVRGSEIPLTPEAMKQLGFEQRLNSKVSLDLQFEDESGQTIELRQCLDSGPAILTLGYYQCPMLCNLVLNGVVESLQEIKHTPAGEINFIFVSVDPTEAADLARAKKETYLKRFGRSGAKDHWHFLTSNERNVRLLADQIGFHYAYDPERKQYAHPSGIIVLTPEGKISRYFFGVSYPAKELTQALTDAGASRTGSIAQPLLMLCSQFMALTGKHSGIIMSSVRVLGVATVLALGGIILAGSRGTHRTAPKTKQRVGSA